MLEHVPALLVRCVLESICLFPPHQYPLTVYNSPISIIDHLGTDRLSKLSLAGIKMPPLRTSDGSKIDLIQDWRNPPKNRICASRYGTREVNVHVEDEADVWVTIYDDKTGESAPDGYRKMCCLLRWPHFRLIFVCDI